MKTAIFKGYDEEGEIWAIGKAYGSGNTKTKFICQIEPTKEIIDEYERRKNVFGNRRKKHGYIGELIRSNDKPLFIFWIENDAQIRRFNEFVLAENAQKLFEIIEWETKYESWKRIFK